MDRLLPLAWIFVGGAGAFGFMLPKPRMGGFAIFLCFCALVVASILEMNAQR